MQFGRVKNDLRAACGTTFRISRLETLESRQLLSLVAELVKDINYIEEPNTQGSSPDGFVTIGSTAYFSATTATGNRELFRSDGTEHGTTMVADLDGNGNPTNFVAVGDVLYFAAAQFGLGTELWRSDGTAAGTVLVRDVRQGADSSRPEPLGSIDGILFFSADDGQHGRELWRTDGTAAGTWMIADIYPGATSSLPSLTSESLRRSATINGRLLFWATDETHGMELWSTDGSTDGTVMLDDSHEGGAPQFARTLLAFDNVVYFADSQEATGTELWAIDGVPGGMRRVYDIFPGVGSSSPSDLAVVNGDLFFNARGSAETGFELWKLDNGLPVQVLDLAPGALSSDPRSMVSLGSLMIFTANDGATGRELWITDGTTDGTNLVIDLLPGSGSALVSSSVFAVDDLVYFYADDQTHGRELFRSDGSAAGTFMLGEIRIGALSPFVQQGPPRFSRAGDELMFVANDGVRGFELWRSDGSVSGTELLKDIRPAGAGSYPDVLVPFGSELLFTADDGFSGNELWRTDGVAANTNQIVDTYAGPSGSYFSGAWMLNDIAVMAGLDSVHGGELWRTDGTAEGTYLLRDIRVGAESSTPNIYARFQSELFFEADDGIHGRAIWRTDGTANGTRLAFDSAESAAWRSQYLVGVSGDRLFFTAEVKVAENAFDERLWVTNGEPTDIQMLPDVNSTSPAAGISRAAAVDGLLFFNVGHALWRSDGTPSGTVQLTDNGPSGAGSYPESFTSHQGELYFSANQGEGRALWKSNGTAQGTQLVKALTTGSGGSSISLYPTKLVSVGEYLYFAGNDDSGNEVWKSDGSEAGTIRVTDISTEFTRIDAMTNVRGTLFFSMYVNGREEVYKVDVTNNGDTRLGQFMHRNDGDAIRTIIGAGPNVYFSALSDAGRELWSVNPPLGDTNFDGEVNIVDLNNVRNNFGATGNVLGDADGDGVVGISDLNAVRNNFGAGVSSPAPVRRATRVESVASAGVDAALIADTYAPALSRNWQDALFRAHAETTFSLEASKASVQTRRLKAVDRWFARL